MSIFSVWRNAIKHRKRDKWLVDEYPKDALAQFQTLRNISPSRTPEELYETIIGGFAITFGIPTEKHDAYTQHVLEVASRPGPVCLRMVVVVLICMTWSLKSELSIAAALSKVSEIIPEDL